MDFLTALSTLAASAATAGLGAALLRVLGFSDLPKSLVLGVGYGIGVVVSAKLLQLLSYLGIALSTSSWMTVATGLLAGLWVWPKVMRQRSSPGQGCASLDEPPSLALERSWLRNAFVIGLLALVAIHISIALVSNLTRPIFPWDAFTTWMYRAKAWTLQDAITAMAFTPNWIAAGGESGNAIYASGYPNALSIYAAFMAALTGGWNGAAASVPWSLGLTALALTVYGSLIAGKLSRSSALIGAYLLVSLPLLNIHAALAGYGDLWMALFSGCGLSALLIWRACRRPITLWLGLLLLLAGTQIKTEGWVWLGLALTFIFTEHLANRIGYAKLVVSLLIMAGLMWMSGLTYFSLGPLGDWGVDNSYIRAGALGSFALRPYNPAVNYGQILFKQGNFLLLAGFYLLAIAIISIRRHRYTASIWSMGLLIITSQVIIFGLSSFSEYAESGTAITRLLLHFTPVAVVTIVLAWPEKRDVAHSPEKSRKEQGNTEPVATQWRQLIASAVFILMALIAPLSALIANTSPHSISVFDDQMIVVVGQRESTDLGTRFTNSPINVGVLKAPTSFSSQPPRYLTADITVPHESSVAFYWMNAGTTGVDSTPLVLSGKTIIDLSRFDAWRTNGKQELGFLVQSGDFEESYIRGFSLSDNLGPSMLPALMNHWTSAEPLTQKSINSTEGHRESPLTLTTWLYVGFLSITLISAALFVVKPARTYLSAVGASLIGLWVLASSITLATTPLLDCLRVIGQCGPSTAGDPHAMTLVTTAAEVKTHVAQDMPILVVDAGNALGAQKLPLLLLPHRAVHVSPSQVPSDWTGAVVLMGEQIDDLSNESLNKLTAAGNERVITLTNARLVLGPNQYQ